ncbi:putative porin [Aureispira anguillae]|uniref:putative porin n=1 Tax=Aureispira anguillae TaxID=2864201 RepID=UPI002231F97F|nr:putative porin [Aureispira anguillae]
MKIIVLTSLLFFLAGTSFLSAQQKIASKRNNKFKIIGDTTKVYYSYLTNPTELLQVDSSLHEFETVDPTWNNASWYISLGGLLATPSFDVLYQPKLKGGFRVGLDQFDNYRLHREDIKYYNIKDNRPYTDLYYSQINQKNNLVKADFAHKFSDNFYLALQYNLSNQTGFFKHQRLRNQNVGFTLRYFSNKSKYHGYLNFITNAVKHENNGGIIVDTLGGLTDDFLANQDVRSTSASTHYNLTEVSYTHFLYNNRVDSLGTNTAASNEWSHRITYQFNRYKYFDTNPPTDGSWYGLASVNPRGIRHFIRHQLLENELSFRQAIGGSLTSAPLWVKAYVKHSWNAVYQEPIDFNIHNISVGLVAQNNPQFKFKYRVEGQLTWAERQLDFSLKGRVGYDMGKLGYLEGQALFQRYQPNLIDRQLYVSWDKVWDNNLLFRQIQELNFGGSYTYKIDKKQWGLQFKGEVLNHTLTNWTYYDSSEVHQATESVNILQVKLQGDFKIWKVHLDNQVVWQPVLAGGDYFRIPQLLFKHNLYLQSYVFKRAMLAKVGLSFYYHTPYQADGYAPLTGAFYNQNSFTTSLDPRLDAYVSFRIWQFRFFIRAENLLHFVYQRNYFTAYRHPVTNFVVRLGISWRLFD